MIDDNEYCGEKRVNTYLVSGHSANQIYSRVVLAKNVEEAVAIMKAQSQYREMVITHVDLRDSCIIVEGMGEK